MTLTFLAVLVVAPARAQDAGGNGWSEDAARGRALAAEGRWEEVRRVLEPLDHALFLEEEDAARQSFGCELGAALVRVADAAGPVTMVNGLAASHGPRRRACIAMYAEALRVADDEQRAAMLYRQLLDEAPLEPQHRSRYESIPTETRVWADRSWRSLRREPLFRLVVADSAELLSRLLARWAMLARPTRIADCYVEEGVEGTDESHGVITCRYHDAPIAEPGMGVQALESLIWERQAGNEVRAIASFAAGVMYDCMVWHRSEPRSLIRLSPDRHGFAGWLYRTHDGWDELLDSQGRPLRRDRTLAWVCGRASGGCVRVEESRSFCVLDDDFAPVQCDADYAGEVDIENGILRVRGRRGAVPAALLTPVRLSETLSPPRPAGRVQSEASATPRRCRLVVDDPQPPLNVRFTASDRAGVVGTLDHGTIVQVDRRARGWLLLRAPVRGWVSSTRVRRVCD